MSDLLPPVKPGHKRQWVCCKKCGGAFYYEFVPYSLSTAILCPPCGHGLGQRFNEAYPAITEEQALEILTRPPA